MNSTGAHPGPRASRWLAGAALVTLLGWVALVFMPPLQHLSYDLAYLLRRPEMPEDVVIVTMDPQSHIELGQSPEGRWSRSLHAVLIDRLQEFQPDAIVLDVIFSEPGIQGAQADVALADAARRSGRVAVAADLFPTRQAGASGTEFRPPFEPLRSATRWGTTRLPQNTVIRESVPTVASHPTLARTVLDMLPPRPGSAPPKTDARFWMRYYGPPGSLPRIPYTSILNGTVPSEQLRHRIVLVGVDYNGPYPAAGADAFNRGLDMFPTPYTRFTGTRAAGVEVVATEILNLYRGEPLRRAPWWIEGIALLILGPVLVLVLLPLRPTRAVLAAGLIVLLITAAGIGSVWPTGIWSPWAIPALVQLPAALLWSLLGHLEQPAVSRAPGSPPLPTSQPGATSVPPPPPVAAHPAVLAIPDYTLLTEIGQGAYGSVWLARDALGTLRAVKVVQRASFSDPAPYDREFEGIRRYTPLSLKHPGFTPILHVGRDDARGFFYYVMEAADDQVSGTRINPGSYAPRTLASDIRSRGALPLSEVVGVGLALGRSLAALHDQNYVHRDLKPENILFIGGTPRLGDAGLVAPRAEHPGLVSQVGTPSYLPSEGPGTATADVFALGKTLYVALTGKPASKFPELPTDFDRRPDSLAFKRFNDILLTACDPDPSQRHPSMSAFVAALESVPC